MPINESTGDNASAVLGTKKKLGLIVNPIAGLGGRVGLKGTDSQEIVSEAIRLGGSPEAPVRTITALQQIKESVGDSLEVVAAAGRMGEIEATEAGFRPTVIGELHEESTAADTKSAVLAMEKAEVDLILFAGGDGTARDIYESIRDRIPVVGIPAGVKMHSAVYATNPRAAANLVQRFLSDAELSLREVEVMDIDEAAFRLGIVSASLYGYMKVPYERQLIQGAKSGSEASDETALAAVAREVAGRIDSEALYILGPGTTLRAIASEVGVQKTLLGVDIYQQGRLTDMDVTANQIAKTIRGNEERTVIVVTPIGGQGHIFGRGNQQITPATIKAVGSDAVMVVATTNKLASLRGRPLLVDTGDPKVDEMLGGYIRVVTGINMESVYPVAS